MFGAGIARLHYIERKEKRLLGFCSGTAQIRTHWTSRIGHRCIMDRRLDVWELLGSFSSMVQTPMPGMSIMRPRYIWHLARGTGTGMANILMSYDCCSSTAPIFMHEMTRAKHHSLERQT